MATLPPSSDITTSTATEGNAKTWFAGIRTFIAQMLGTDGTQSAALTALGVPFNASTIKTGAYTVTAADRGKVIKCSGTWTLAFDAASSLGDGFVVEIVNDGAGVITLNPNLSEQIDGVTTITLAADKTLAVYCDGTKFVTFGRGGVESINGNTGAITAAQIATAANSGNGGVANHAHDYAPTTAIVAITSSSVNYEGNTTQAIATRANGSTFSFSAKY